MPSTKLRRLANHFQCPEHQVVRLALGRLHFQTFPPEY
jgi:hypothetical protein